MRDNDDFGISDYPTARTPSTSSSEEDLAGILQQALVVAEQIIGPDLENEDSVITISSSDEEDEQQEAVEEEDEQHEDEDNDEAAAAAPAAEEAATSAEQPGAAQDDPADNSQQSEAAAVAKKDASTSTKFESASSDKHTPENEPEGAVGGEGAPLTRDASTSTEFELAKDYELGSEESEESAASAAYKDAFDFNTPEAAGFNKSSPENDDDYKGDNESSGSSDAAPSNVAAPATSGGDKESSDEETEQSTSGEAGAPTRRVDLATVVFTASSEPVPRNGATASSAISNRVLRSLNQRPLLQSPASPRVLQWVATIERAHYNLHNVAEYDRIEIFEGRELLIHWLVRNWSMRDAVPEEQALMQQLLQYNSEDDEDDLDREVHPQRDHHHEESDEDEERYLRHPNGVA